MCEDVYQGYLCCVNGHGAGLEGLMGYIGSLSSCVRPREGQYLYQTVRSRIIVPTLWTYGGNLDEL